MEQSSQLKIYKRRNPQTTSLWKLLNCHFVDFEECYDRLFRRKYGFNRPVISHVVRKYLECGGLHQGFARIKCPDCHHQFILAFSCRRGRWFCPSCHNKRWFTLVIILKKQFSIQYRIDNMSLAFQKFYASFFYIIVNCWANSASAVPKV